MVHSQVQPNPQRQTRLHSALLALVFAALLLCVSALAAFSQGFFSAGTTVPFVLFPADARSHAMGRTGTGDRMNPYASQWNIAAAAPLFPTTSESATSVTTLDSAINIPKNPFAWDTSDVVWKRNNRNVFLSVQRPSYITNNGLLAAASVQGLHIGPGSLVVSGKYFALGNNTLNDVANEFSASVGYAVAASSEVSIGVQLNYIQSELIFLQPLPITGKRQVIGRAFSADIGVLYTPEILAGIKLDKRVSFGATLRNMGGTMSYNEFADPLPTEFRAGIAADIVRTNGNRLSLQGDINVLLVNRRAGGNFDTAPVVLLTGWRNPVQASIGAEYAINETLFFRAGYVDDSNRFMTNFQRVSFGGGYHFAFAWLDFALDIPLNGSDIASTMTISVPLKGS